MRDRARGLAARSDKGELGGGGIRCPRFCRPQRHQAVLDRRPRIAQPQAKLASLQVGPVVAEPELEGASDRSGRLIRASRREQRTCQEGVHHRVIRSTTGSQSQLLDCDVDPFVRERAEPFLERIPDPGRRDHSSSMRAMTTGMATGMATGLGSRPRQPIEPLSRLQAAIPSGARIVVATLTRTTAE